MLSEKEQAQQQTNNDLIVNTKANNTQLTNR